MESKHPCCKATLSLYVQWLTTAREAQLHQATKHTTLMDTLRQVLLGTSSHEILQGHIETHKHSKYMDHKLSTNNDAESSKDNIDTTNVPGLSAAGLNDPVVQVGEDHEVTVLRIRITKVLRCLRQHLLLRKCRVLTSQKN